MIIFLLIIIAIGVFLISDVGRSLLVRLLGLVKFFGILIGIGLIGIAVYYILYGISSFIDLAGLGISLFFISLVSVSALTFFYYTSWKFLVKNVEKRKFISRIAIPIFLIFYFIIVVAFAAM